MDESMKKSYESFSSCFSKVGEAAFCASRSFYFIASAYYDSDRTPSYPLMKRKSYKIKMMGNKKI